MNNAGCRKLFVEFLRKHEDELSDGFGYYVPFEDVMERPFATAEEVDAWLDMLAGQFLDKLTLMIE